MFKVGSLVIFCIFVIVNSTERCDVTDTECKKLMYQKIFTQATDGIPSMKIPKFNPMRLKNIVFSLPNGLKLVMEEGIGTGFKYCKFDQMYTHLEEPVHTALNLTCNIIVDGRFTVTVPKTVMKKIGCEDTESEVIIGHGNGKITMDNLHVLVVFPFHFIRREKDIYLNTKNLNIFHEVHDTVVFSSKDMVVGNRANGKKIVKYLNDQAVKLDLISPIMNKMLAFFEIFSANYLNKVPAKNLYTSDLSNYTVSYY